MLVQHFGDRRQRVSGARGHRQDVVLRRIVLRIIHPWHQRHVHIVRGRADEHLASAALQVSGGVLAAAQRPARFDHHIDARPAPRDVGRLFLRRKLHGLPVHQDGVVIMRHLAWEEPMHRIILEQIGEVAEMGEIVDRHHLDVWQGERAAQDHAANASKSVNAYATGHMLSSLE